MTEEFKRLLTESVGADKAEVALKALTEEPSVSIRLNPEKLKECPFPDAENVPWSPYGYLLKERPSFTLDPLFHAGCYYVQDSSAMFPGHVARRFMDRPGMTVLDLCAAPGGKSTDLAASLRERFADNFTLLSNEVIRARYNTLRSNMETWGDCRTGTLSRDPSAFGNAPLFDMIVADVPCSGEGMFRKDQKAVEDWSLDTVQFCAARSRRILADIWPTLTPGGILIYSTCTFNHFENDDTVEWIATELGADIIPPEDFPPAILTRCGQILLPGFVPGEGQYVAALRKHGDALGIRRGDPLKIFRAEMPAQAGHDGKTAGHDGKTVGQDGRAVTTGTDRWSPDSPHVNVDRQTALQYLHGDALRLEDAPLGLITICYEGHPLGAAKNLGTRCNNLYPKEKRIRTMKLFYGSSRIIEVSTKTAK